MSAEVLVIMLPANHPKFQAVYTISDTLPMMSTTHAGLLLCNHTLMYKYSSAVMCPYLYPLLSLTLSSINSAISTNFSFHFSWLAWKEPLFTIAGIPLCSPGMLLELAHVRPVMAFRWIQVRVGLSQAPSYGWWEWHAT